MYVILHNSEMLVGRLQKQPFPFTKIRKIREFTQQTGRKKIDGFHCFLKTPLSSGALKTGKKQPTCNILFQQTALISTKV